MATGERGSDDKDRGSGISRRAGTFLEINYTGGSKDKRIARDLGISPYMAKLLRSGRGWTVARVEQALELFPGFRDFVFGPPQSEAAQLVARIEELARGFARLGDELAALRRELRDERPRRRAAKRRGPPKPNPPDPP